MIERLDEFLAHPRFDPHGDPIPDADGNFAFRKQVPLNQLAIGESGVIVGVQNHSTPFLQYLDHLSLVLGTEVTVLEKFEYDESIKIKLKGKEMILSKKVNQNLFIQKN